MPGSNILPLKRRPAAAGFPFALIAGGGCVARLAVFLLMPGEPAIGADQVSARMASPASREAAGADRLSGRFGLCSARNPHNCVVDGDTFRFAGRTYRVADIDTPETHPARCMNEAALGDAATARLRDWLNAGSFALASVDRDADRYGRKLRIVSRGGESVGEMLIAEGLARRWGGYRRPWC